MPIRIKNLTINTDQLDKMVTFYRAVGIHLNQHSVNKGTTIYKGTFADLELNLMGIPRKEKKLFPDVSLQIQVQSLDECARRLKEMKEVQIVLDLTEMPHGKMMVVLDPDGHSVELIEG